MGRPCGGKGGQVHPEAQLIGPAEAAALASDGALLVDVRTGIRRREDGLIPEAVLVDRTRIGEDFGFASTDRLPEVMGPDQEVVVFCTSEKGSTPIVNEQVELGFGSVFHVEGGFRAWAAAGLPTIAPADVAGDCGQPLTASM